MKRTEDIILGVTVAVLLLIVLVTTVAIHNLKVPEVPDFATTS
jgi:hypothetical protein